LLVDFGVSRELAHSLFSKKGALVGELWDCICDVQQNLFLDGNVGLARGGVDGVDETLMSNNEGGR
jgi:hypothetical protein